MQTEGEMLPELEAAIEALASLDRVERLEALIAYGERLPALSDAARAQRDAGEHIIRDCQSPVFFRVDADDSVLRLQADVPREAPVARGFTAMLCVVFDGAPVSALSTAPRDLLSAAGLDEALTFQRRRGLGAIYGKLLECKRNG